MLNWYLFCQWSLWIVFTSCNLMLQLVKAVLKTLMHAYLSCSNRIYVYYSKMGHSALGNWSIFWCQYFSTFPLVRFWLLLDLSICALWCCYFDWSKRYFRKYLFHHCCSQTVSWWISLNTILFGLCMSGPVKLIRHYDVFTGSFILLLLFCRWNNIKVLRGLKEGNESVLLSVSNPPFGCAVVLLPFLPTTARKAYFHQLPPPAVLLDWQMDGFDHGGHQADGRGDPKRAWGGN